MEGINLRSVIILLVVIPIIHCFMHDEAIPMKDSALGAYVKRSIQAKIKRKKADNSALYKGNTTEEVSQACMQAWRVYDAGKDMGEEWAETMADAEGDFTGLPGAFFGQRYATGAYDQCLRVKATHMSVIDEETNTTIGMHDFDAKYCLLNGNLIFGDSFPYSVNEGACVPETCSAEEVIILSVNKNIDRADCSKPRDIRKDAGAIAVLSVLVVFAVLVLVSTIYEVVMVTRKEKRKAKAAEYTTLGKVQGSKTEETSEIVEMTRFGGPEDADEPTKEPPPIPSTLIVKPTPKTRNPGRIEQAFLAFSLYKNAPNLLSPSSSRGAYNILNGLRFLAMTWIVLGHAWVTTLHMVANPRIKAFTDPRFMHYAINVMPLSVEVFFVLSGFLVMISFSRTITRLMDSIQGRSRCQKALLTIKELLLFVFHRYIRLTPVFFILMMCTAYLYIYMAEGPFFPTTSWGHSENCKRYWWVNMLYVQNFVNYSCMGQGWYLAVDFQFYLLVPIHGFLFYWSPIAGVVFAAICWLANLIARFVLTFKGMTNSFEEMYIKPYTRYGPYLIGMVLAYIIMKTKNKKVNLPKSVVILGWAVSFCLGMLMVFGPYRRSHCEVGVDGCVGWPANLGRVYNAVHRDVFSFALAWLIFACLNGYGGILNRFLSWNGWTPLSKLAFVAYLLHQLIQDVVLQSRRHVLYMQDITMIYLYLGNLVMSLLIAIPLCLMFEIPFINLDQVMFPRKKKKS